MMKFTKPQLRALEWLPSDGSWRDKSGIMTASLDSLHRLNWRDRHRSPSYVDWEFGRKFGTNGGEGRRWRLTQYGIEAKRELVAEGLIKEMAE